MTAASAALSPSPVGSTWVDRYERLRQRGLELGARWLEDAQGLVLFLRGGMVSWMIERPSPQPPKPIPRAGHSALIRDDRMEVARMLAIMIGSAVAEVPA
jgi:hypothetical protein